MIHPDAGNAVSVRKEITVPVSDDGSIGSIDSDAAVIFDNHFADILGIHQKQG